MKKKSSQCANAKNPNDPAHKAAQDNEANKNNPNNSAHKAAKIIRRIRRTRIIGPLEEVRRKAIDLLSS
jgi:hypothetical protein